MIEMVGNRGTIREQGQLIAVVLAPIQQQELTKSLLYEYTANYQDLPLLLLTNSLSNKSLAVRPRYGNTTLTV
jgi:hypothetical protein